jgi:tRNA G18 (ribose-2'-O)-methylase SpoU
VEGNVSDFFGIGIVNTKRETNIGTLWRSAHNFGAAFIFTVGRRYERQSSDTTKAWRSIPLFNFETLDDLRKHVPYDTQIVGVELDPRAILLPAFAHPRRCVYVLGAEDHGLSPAQRAGCHSLIVVPGAAHCLNVAAAGTVVLYDRIRRHLAVAA